MPGRIFFDSIVHVVGLEVKIKNTFITKIKSQRLLLETKITQKTSRLHHENMPI